MSSICTSILPLEYIEAGEPLGLLNAHSSSVSEEAAPVIMGVPEEEVERRIQLARDAAHTEVQQRILIERERISESCQEKVGEILRKFATERAEYFRRIESEVVQLALAIARKILQRELEVDPTLLIALVRVALDRMQYGSIIRIRVAPEHVDLWHRCEDANTAGARWQIVADETLNSGDCLVETELGAANFGIEAQLRDVQESFAQLLAHSPTTQSSHAAGA